LASLPKSMHQLRMKLPHTCHDLGA
jgi:hypothetical protein